jgi:hypothetical protein
MSSFRKRQHHLTYNGRQTQPAPRAGLSAAATIACGNQRQSRKKRLTQFFAELTV